MVGGMALTFGAMIGAGLLCGPAAPIAIPSVMMAGGAGTVAGGVTVAEAFREIPPRVLGQAPRRGLTSDTGNSSDSDDEEITIHATTRRVHRRDNRGHRRRRRTRPTRT